MVSTTENRKGLQAEAAQEPSTGNSFVSSSNKKRQKILELAVYGLVRWLGRITVHFIFSLLRVGNYIVSTSCRILARCLVITLPSLLLSAAFIVHRLIVSRVFLITIRHMI